MRIRELLVAAASRRAILPPQRAWSAGHAIADAAHTRTSGFGARLRLAKNAVVLQEVGEQAASGERVGGRGGAVISLPAQRLLRPLASR